MSWRCGKCMGMQPEETKRVWVDDDLIGQGPASMMFHGTYNEFKTAVCEQCAADLTGAPKSG